MNAPMPVCFASVQTRVAWPATRIIRMAPATAPLTGASVSAEAGVVNTR